MAGSVAGAYARAGVWAYAFVVAAFAFYAAGRDLGPDPRLCDRRGAARDVAAVYATAALGLAAFCAGAYAVLAMAHACRGAYRTVLLLAVAAAAIAISAGEAYASRAAWSAICRPRASAGEFCGGGCRDPDWVRRTTYGPLWAVSLVLALRSCVLCRRAGAGEQRAGEQRAGEQRAGEQKVGDQKASERSALLPITTDV